MFITPAFAQAAGAPAGAGDFIGMILPLVLIMGVFYFLLIRPQQKKQKQKYLLKLKKHLNKRRLKKSFVHKLKSNIFLNWKKRLQS